MEWAIFIAILIVSWLLERKLDNIENNFSDLNDELQSIKNHMGLTPEHEEFMREVEMDREIQKIVNEGEDKK